jgi:3-deoxy-manno-octulosonate cytidylyltransferase (CMP-KDO synthetase)
MRNKIKTCAIIPARMAATRFPGKPLAKILGISLIEHTRRRAVLSGLFDRVFVATCDQVILDEVEKYGGSGFMTSASHQRCTDRIEEVARKIDSEIIVNIQGDEPLVMGESLQRLINPFFESDEALTTNIVNPVFKKEELESPNVVKAVLSNSKKILYMSRSIIPGNPFTTDTCYYKQTGLIAFRKDLLHRYARLAPTPLEIKESCDMLRLIENDVSVQGVVCEHRSIGVDIPEQINQVEEFIMNFPEQRRVYEMIK